VTVFATPEPTWNAMVAALDEDPPDEAWAFKLAVQCRNHLRVALGTEETADLMGGPSVSEWNRDPGARTVRRIEVPGRTSRTAKDTPGGVKGPSGAYERWHVLLGVLIAHEFEVVRRDPPVWTRKLHLDKEWVMSRPKMTDTQIRSTAPEWLSVRGIFVSKLDLAA
jgi:hypothetical protein